MGSSVCLSLARMAKTKKNRRGMAEKAATKPKSAVKRLNPFDVRFVKNPKQTVIGRKVKKDVGKPGHARAKAIQKRKETLLQEYQQKNKNNMFLDKRIGEKDNNLSAEDKMVARFTAQRIREIVNFQSWRRLQFDARRRETGRHRQIR